RIWARARAGAVRHEGNAAWAASTAALASLPSLSTTSAMLLSFEGSRTPKLLPIEATQRPPMKLRVRIRSARERLSGMRFSCVSEGRCWALDRNRSKRRLHLLEPAGEQHVF